MYRVVSSNYTVFVLARIQAASVRDRALPERSLLALGFATLCDRT
ncbi:MAG TPA: hypothetical protein V6D43_15575 [Candidatus Sericytochromatia bacterium]